MIGLPGNVIYSVCALSRQLGSVVEIPSNNKLGKSIFFIFIKAPYRFKQIS